MSTKTVMRPIADRLIIRADAKETKTSGGIVVPDASADKPQQGIVVAVGPGRLMTDGTRLPMQSVVGDRVLFSTYTETITIDNEQLVLIREDDAYAILEVPGDGS